MKDLRTSPLFGLFFVTILAALSGLLIIGVEAWTAEAVEAAGRERLEGVIRGLLPEGGAVSFGELAPGITLIDSGVPGYEALLVRGNGLWGPMETVFLIDTGNRRIESAAVLEHEETPGIGSRVTEPEFLARFAGKSMEEELNIDALAGATMSSRALSALAEAGRVAWAEERGKLRE